MVKRFQIPVQDNHRVVERKLLKAEFSLNLDFFFLSNFHLIREFLKVDRANSKEKSQNLVWITHNSVAFLNSHFAEFDLVKTNSFSQLLEFDRFSLFQKQ